MSTISSGTTSTTTLVHSGDTTGSLVFKTNDTGSGGTTALTLDTSQNATFVGNVNTGSGKKYQVGSSTVSALAWVRLNASGVVQSSYNISSVTINAAGDYTLNFTNALADANYAVGGSASDTPTYDRLISVCGLTAPSTTLVRVACFSRSAGALGTSTYMSFMIFGN